MGNPWYPVFVTSVGLCVCVFFFPPVMMLHFEGAYANVPKKGEAMLSKN